MKLSPRRLEYQRSRPRGGLWPRAWPLLDWWSTESDHTELCDKIRLTGRLEVSEGLWEPDSGDSLQAFMRRNGWTVERRLNYEELLAYDAERALQPSAAEIQQRWWEEKQRQKQLKRQLISDRQWREEEARRRKEEERRERLAASRASRQEAFERQQTKDREEAAILAAALAEVEAKRRAEREEQARARARRAQERERERAEEEARTLWWQETFLPQARENQRRALEMRAQAEAYRQRMMQLGTTPEQLIQLARAYNRCEAAAKRLLGELV